MASVNDLADGNRPGDPEALGVIVIAGGLIYFPMLILSPIGERIVS